LRLCVRYSNDDNTSQTMGFLYIYIRMGDQFIYQSDKITDVLKKYLEKENPESVTVIIELSPDHPVLPHSVSKKEKMQSMKDNFNFQMSSLVSEVKSMGGDIIDAAWLNKTAKVQLPTNSLNKLAEIKSIELIDLPRQLKAM